MQPTKPFVMRKATRIFCLLLFLASFTSNCFSQQSYPKGVFLNVEGEGNYAFDRSIINDTEASGSGYYYKKIVTSFGKEATEYMVNSITSQKSWPSAINSRKKREQPRTNEMLLKYTMYVLLKFPEYINRKDTYTYLLYLPEAENRHMPSGYKLKKDLYILANYKCVQIDSSQTKTVILPHVQRQVKQFDLSQLPAIVNWMDDDSISAYKPIYTNQLGEKVFHPTYELEGFYGYNIQGVDGHKRFIGESFAGTNLKQAEENFYQIKWRVDDYLEDSSINSAFKLVSDESQPNKNSLKLVNPGFNPNYGLQVTLQLVNNSDPNSGVTGQKGYTSRLEVQRYIDPTDAFWQQLADENTWDGYKTFTKQTRSGTLLEDLKLPKLKEVVYALFSEDSDRISILRNKDNKITLNPPKPFKNIWLTTGKLFVGRGDYEFYSVLLRASVGIGDNLLSTIVMKESANTGRTLLVYGYRDTEESLRRAAIEDSAFQVWEANEQKIRYSSSDEYYRKLRFVEDTLRLLMKKGGYTSIDKIEFKGPGEFKIPMYDHEHLYMASISFSKNSKLQLVQLSHKLVESCLESRIDGVYVNTLHIKSGGNGTFLGDVFFKGTGGDKDQTTIVLYSRQDGEAEIEKENDELDEEEEETWQMFLQGQDEE